MKVMDGHYPQATEAGEAGAPACPAPVVIRRPREQTAPIVISSPHSGRYYPPDLTAATRLDPRTLRKSEDCFVDDLYAAAPDCGLPLIAANYARAYLDCNREPFEWDPAMFAERLPAYANTLSPGVRIGFGTIARRVSPHDDIYAGKLTIAEAERRVRRIHRPYHQALKDALDRSMALFPQTFLIDAHSMPRLPASEGRAPAQIVLGDRYGTSAAPWFVDKVHRFLADRGYLVARNRPYAGGFITQSYGRPGKGCHALQIEVDRSLYMNETGMTKTAGFDRLREDITDLLRELHGWTSARLQPGHASRGAEAGSVMGYPK